MKLIKPYIMLIFLVLGAGWILVAPMQQTEAQYKVFLPIIFKAPPTKGVVIPDAYSFCTDTYTLNVDWYYRNSTSPIPDCPVTDTRFVPRLANGNILTTQIISDAIASASQRQGWIIGFTEPNINYWPSYMTPRDGAIAWRQIEAQALPAGMKLVAPAPSPHDPGGLGGAATDGYTWIWKMIDAYRAEYGTDPHFDAFGWNYYHWDPNQFYAFFNARRSEALDKGYNIPFWVLEYSGQCWNTINAPPFNYTGNTAIMTQVTPWFESTSWIDRYAWFANRIKPDDAWAPNWDSCTLINPNTGDVTSLGVSYQGY
ncbi:MAG: hypothetical protein D6768_06905 [Chloroflexi bacterium]|nr:MAG: hypothetical protein D6768_06905 [Chloroflexota bacterium]